MGRIKIINLYTGEDYKYKIEYQITKFILNFMFPLIIFDGLLMS